MVWLGRGSTTEEALDKYDIDQARYSPDLSRFIRQWLKRGHGEIYLLHPGHIALSGESSIRRGSTGRVNTKLLQPAMNSCRCIKDDHEVGLIKKANEISALAHEEVLRSLRSFSNEGQVEARFLDVSIAHGAKHQSYGLIAGSGENAAILHYQANDQDFKDRQLLCLDAGAEWNCYSSDVTRTFPLSGQWPSKEAKEIYDLVDEMQRSAMKVIGPGKLFINAHIMAHKIAVDGLLRLGVLHNGTSKEILEAGTSLAFYPHGLGHHMGLEVHDVSPNGRSASLYQQSLETYGDLSNDCWSDHLQNSTICRAPCQTGYSSLEPGMVITVEPGVYFNRYALERIYLPDPVHSKYINKKVLERYIPVGGVRIEDDILITKSGWENLTTAAKGDAALKIIRGEK